MGAILHRYATDFTQSLSTQSNFRRYLHDRKT